jgi:protein involved in polysaccharide export with SLBB domain
MRVEGSFVTRAFSALVLLLGLAAPLAAQTPTAEQLQIFQNLTPEQQQAVLDRVAPSGSAVQDADSASGADSGAGTPERAARAPAKAEPVIPTLAGRDTVMLKVSVPPDVAATEKPRLDRIVAVVLSRNPYELDRNAQLNLPGFAPIALGGLTEEQATQRLLLEPALAGLTVKLTRLPVDKLGAKGLKPFGYDLFDNAPSSFSPVTNVPVPADYVVGPGDELNVQLFGNQNITRRLPVSRDGSISFPELGPINVGGLTFSAARRAVETRVTQQMIGVQVSVTMGETRTIRVLVMGVAKQFGSYTVSGLATMTTALFASGGITDIGSLRDVQLKRQGAVVSHLDLYDLLIGGDTSDDARLQPGDVIFIPPVGATVSIDGEVKRPAIYELLGEGSIGDLVRIAGGLTPEADANRASLTRIDTTNRRVVLDVNLADATGRDQLLRNGDVLQVAPLRPQLDAGVALEGFVYRPGLFAWRQGMHLTDVIGSIDELRPGADQNYVLIRRESGADRRTSLLSADLTAALAARGSAADPELFARDQIYVFDLAPGRERIIEPLLEEQRLQSSLARPTPVVSVWGLVKVPGDYPLEPDMRVGDLLRAGGNLRPSAYGGTAELTRYVVNASGTREAQLLTIDLAGLRRGDPAANLELQPYDYLLVQETPEWGDQETVTLRGEVRFPGVYPIRRGETLHEVLDRAGGLTGQAFPQGSAFTRSDLKILEQKQLDRLSENMRSDLVTLSLQAARAGQSNAGDTLLAGQSLLAQLQAAKATGRFVIDLPGLLATGVHSEKDVLLRDGDELTIPKQRQEVTVIGEVQNSTSHLYQAKLSRDDYIKMSGGVSRRADRAHIYVVRADGSVATDKGINPGDTIVIPVDAERMPRLPFWQAVTQILYNVAVSVAAVNSF